MGDSFPFLLSGFLLTPFELYFYTSQYHQAILQSGLLVINIFLPSRVSTHREFLMLTLCMQAAHVSPDLEQRKNPPCKELLLNSLTSVTHLIVPFTIVISPLAELKRDHSRSEWPQIIFWDCVVESERDIKLRY